MTGSPALRIVVVAPESLIAEPDDESALQEAEVTLNRPVHVSLMTEAEWRRKLAAGNPFITKVQAQPKILLIGSEDDLA